jgi:hypothetical protein
MSWHGINWAELDIEQRMRPKERHDQNAVKF